jgi:hypothetical protein
MTFALRLILELVTQAGNDPSCVLDTDEETTAGLSLTGFDTLVPGQVIQVGPSDIDVPFAISDALAVVVFSDIAVKMRLAAAEKQMNGLLWAFQGADELNEMLAAGSLLFTGDTANTANVTIWVIEKP